MRAFKTHDKRKYIQTAIYSNDTYARHHGYNIIRYFDDQSPGHHKCSRRQMLEEHVKYNNAMNTKVEKIRDHRITHTAMNMMEEVTIPEYTRELTMATCSL